MPSRRALLSVSDKSGLVDFARGLVARDFELLSTGGTARALREAGLEVTEVADVTGHPEMLEGRVKTLHPAIHSGLLSRRDHPGDRDELAEAGYRPIDLVAVNLYPFRETVASGNVALPEAMEQVDIGGPTMIRAAAKNHRDVWVVVDPHDYPKVLEQVDAPETASLRRALAQKVFEHVSAYDAAVAAYLAGEGDPVTDPLPFTVDAPTGRTLRYGENPDQPATFHPLGGESAGVAALEQLHGKELSYNNILDLDGALLSLAPFAWSPRPAAVIVKHTTPCGIAVGHDLATACSRARATDPVSAFGSVIAVNRPVDRATAEALSDLFIECLVAPHFDEAALAVLTQKKNVRLLTFPETPPPPLADEPGGALPDPDARAAARFLAAHSLRPEPRTFRSVYGGVLVQQPPRPPFHGMAPDSAWSVVTRRAPTAEERADLDFAWAAIFGVKSNAILLARDGATVGIGAGQMSRVDSSRLAVWKAGDAGLSVEGSVLASDAFFPFRDGVEAAAEAGVRAIIQPGGSVRDAEVIAAADEAGIAMMFTGRRLFRH